MESGKFRVDDLRVERIGCREGRGEWRLESGEWRVEICGL